MDKILIKLKDAVAVRSGGGPAIKDVRAATLTFNSYRWVLMAVLVTALYYVFWASDRYVSIAHLYVKSTDAGGGGISSQLQMLGGGQSQTQDGPLLSVYTQSLDMLRKMEQEVSFSEHFSSDLGDYFSRMSKDPSEEERLRFFKEHLSVGVNPDSGIITIRGQGYTPEFAHKFVEAVIAASDAFINGVGHKIAKEEIAFVERELARGRTVLEAARVKLVDFQNENNILSVELAGAALQQLVSQMEADLVQLNTEETVLAAYLNAAAAELITARVKIAALEKQLVIERSKLASTEGKSFNVVGAEYQALEMDLKFATDLYKTALVALERARIESYHKLKHLVVVQSPTQPDEAAYPRKIYNLLTLFIGLSLAYGIVTMILATIREHRDV